VIYLNHLHSSDPYTIAQCQAVLQVSCYLPSQVQQAYDLTSLYSRGVTGKGTRIVLIEAYGSPTISSDLAQFDAAAGLPAPWLDVVRPDGAMPAYRPGNADMVGWAGETTLDVEWAHAVAPGAGIVLVEAPDDSPASLMKVVQYAIGHRLGDVISQSWGFAEPTLSSRFMAAEHAVYAASVRERETVVAAAGDQGASGYLESGKGFYGYPVTDWPATDPDVTAVGGTKLDLGPAGNRLWPDTAWNDSYSSAVNFLISLGGAPNPIATGGGLSTVFRRPSYQDAGTVERVVGGSRGIPDISMIASCSGSVEVYQTFGGAVTGWNEVCGTSESAPMFAGIVALAAQLAGHPLGLINPAIYKLAADRAAGIVPVTSGNNSVAFTQDGKTVSVHGYYARHGYSLVSGVGTIDAADFVPELASSESTRLIPP
jgi:subtilase family serine protease